MSESKIWTCKIGECGESDILPGDDGPMRKAVADRYRQLTDKDPDFIFSGWDGELTEPERAVVENRDPVAETLHDLELEGDVEYLWSLLDNIDTLSDSIKPSTPEGYEAFYKAAMKQAQKRTRDWYSPDGYKLVRKAQCPTSKGGGDE